MASVKEFIVLVFAMCIVLGVGALLLRGSNLGTTTMISTTVLPTQITTTVIVQPQNVVQQSFFGMDIDFANTTSWPGVPVGTLSIMGGAGWASIEGSQGSYNWSPIDSAIAQGKAHGVSSFMYTFYDTPQWASRSGLYCGYSTMVGCSAPPANISYWEQFVSAVASRYAGQIRYYVLWYEPDNSKWWSGNVSQMVSMAAVAYNAIKSADPNAIVLTPAVSPDGVVPYYSGCGSACWISSYLSAGGGRFADGVAWHGYYCSSGINGTCYTTLGCSSALGCAGQPLLTQVAMIRSSMNQTGNGAKPLFDVGGGWGANANLGNQSIESAYISRWYILQASSGVNVSVWDSWSQYTGASAYGSMISAQRVSQAYAQTYDWLDGALFGQPCNEGDGLWSCDITLKDGAGGQIMWSNLTNSSGTIAYFPPSTYTRYQSLNGSVTELSPNETIRVGYSPILIET